MLDAGGNYHADTGLPRRGKSSKHRLRTISHVDQRSRGARRVRALTKLWTQALGWIEPTPMQALALEHAAASTALAEDLQARALLGDTSVTPEQITKLANVAARAVRVLGLPGDTERRPEAETIPSRVVNGKARR